MKSIYASLLVLAACFSTTVQAAPADDSVHIAGMPSAGYWLNKPALSVAYGNSLSITATKGTDFFHYGGGDFKATNAPILLFQPDADFTVTAKVKVGFNDTYDGGAIFVYADSTHYIKFLFEKSHYGYLSVCSGVTNTFTDDATNAVSSTNEVLMRLSKRGNFYGMFYSLDAGKSWTAARMVNFNPGGKIKLGFSSQSPLGAECESIFSDIKYKPTGFKDNKNGE
ncbi:hypothetical protein SAMN05444266_110112 [Chitinophaga jiangningensis]|uniref:DUF1349 domain-containing protein n=1 Tax=Chitinophaga jiangningensis TaxID=1419482 RepID=A0A1M7L3C2_9BACT|nr:DUF1349 domain-containing protein [Chitinophaga jiangningensis]SHM72246.1 hypothetical protein SAMN05444266_110112 [Chitinophaga jiangningensis]